MFKKDYENQASKFMSFILRHAKHEIDIAMDENGWVSVEEFIEKANKSGKTQLVFSKELIEQVVKNNDKQRFALNDNKTLLRANQGHTMEVNLDLPFVEPPEFLFHGTAIQNVESILKQGLKPMQRHDVHLSFSKETAKSVGMRYGKPYIFVIKAKEMYEQGYQFQCTKNNVWLTKNVPTEFLIKEKE